MPKIDLYKNVFSRKPEKIEIAEFLEIFKSQAVKDTIIAIRSVEDKKVKAELKKKLPAWTPMSTTESTRSVENSKPTGFIMFDYDHLEYNIESTFRNWFSDGRAGLLIAHITPSGKGLRLVFRTEAGQEITKQFIEEQHEKLGLHVFGEYDKACSDYCRLSFITDEASVLYVAEVKEWETSGAPTTSASEKKEESSQSASEKILETASPKYSKDEILYKGHKVSEIAEAYVAEKGEPEDGEKHLYYNQLVKNFRNICDNNPEKVASVLPMFGESYTYRLSQCKSICKANSTTYLPKAFYFWLRKKGYLVETAKEENEEDVEEVKDNPPFLPPIFREFVQVAPRDFMLPVINSIMPVLGTLTSFLRADYFDGEEQSTTFFSVIYAPAGHGKSFTKRIIPVLLNRFRVRDRLSQMREEIFINLQNSKADNQELPDDPHVSMREMPSITSQPELLTKMRDNKGYHIFTFESEIDTWAKGGKAAGNDKSDMIRIAWDNGEYGQAFKSAKTFKGIVKLYWNVLVTGTPLSMRKYFKNVEDGLVTRCSFADLGDQRFAKPLIWKKMSAKAEETIKKIVDFCDEQTYHHFLDEDIDSISDLDKEEVKEKVKMNAFKPKQYVDMEWAFPPLLEWLEQQRIKASQELDDARDTLRRRCALKGFRLALMCSALYSRLDKKNKANIMKFVIWWMNHDIKNSLDLFGKEMNDIDYNQKSSEQRINVLSEMPKEFDKNDLRAVLNKNFIKTPVRQILHLWKKRGLIEKISTKTYRKK